MAKINPHSLEWKAILSFIDQESQSAINNLIADNQSERQRGAIQILDKLSKLVDPELEAVQTDIYST